MRLSFLLSFIFCLCAFPARALDPHYTNKAWAETIDHLQAAKTAKNPLIELEAAKKRKHDMWQRYDHKLDEFNRASYDIDGAIAMAKRGAETNGKDRQQMCVKIDSAIAHLRAAK